MKPETTTRLYKYVEKNRKPFEGLTRATKELENMRNAKMGGKEWHEKNEKRGFYPQPAAIKSVQRKSKHIQKILDKHKK